MPEILLIIFCIVIVWLGTEYINRKPKRQPGVIPVTQNLEVHPGFEEDQVIIWNGGTGITVDKRDFREEFLNMDIAEIHRELKEKRR